VYIGAIPSPAVVAIAAHPRAPAGSGWCYVGVPFLGVKRTTVRVPDGLLAKVREMDLNASEIFRSALEQRVADVDACPHTRLRCESCGAHLDSLEAAAELEDEGSPA
jgi:hypothetical protein